MITTLLYKFIGWLFVQSEDEQNLPLIFLIPLVFLGVLLLFIAVPLDVILFPIEAIISLRYLYKRGDIDWLK